MRCVLSTKTPDRLIKVIRVGAHLHSDAFWLLFLPFVSCVDTSEIARLSARPHAPAVGFLTGRTKLGLGNGRDGFLYIPSSCLANEAAPLAVVLHGAGQSADLVDRLLPFAEELGIIILSPESRGKTWDFIMSKNGRDFMFLDRAMDFTFDRWLIDPEKIALVGFSDGASYALSLGLNNADLFSHLIAFSPGFLLESKQLRAPRIFISHGKRDQILPIGTTSRPIVAMLEKKGFDVQYREFEGGHLMEGRIVVEALEWFVH